MLFLFLTGKRSAYLNAILTVLYFPEGAIYDLKYTDLEEGSIVDRSAGIFSRSIDEDVLILFDSRNGEYIPLRYGKLKNYFKEEGQIYYSVELHDYCHAQSESKFNAFMDNIAPDGGIRHLTDSVNDFEASEGILAFSSNNISGINLEKSTTSWIITIKRLSECMEKQNAFTKYYFVFTKLEILEEKRSGGDLLKNSESRLKSGKNYKFHMTYYIPKFNDKPMESIPVEFYQSNKKLGIIEKKDILLSRQNKMDIYCMPKTDSTKLSKVTFRFNIAKTRIGNTRIQYARTPLEIDLLPRMSKNVRYILIGLSFGGIVLGTYMSGITIPESVEGTRNILWFAKNAGGFLVAGATSAMIWFAGKPKL